MNTTTPSIIGFKDSKVDLRKKSPGIFWSSALVSCVLIFSGLRIPFIQEEEIEKKVKVPPVIIRLENIPETRHQVSAPAPTLSMPLEVGDDVMLDDVTIESTELNLENLEPLEVKPIIVQEEILEEEEVVEEIFEFFAVEEQPQRISEVIPEYSEAARRAGIEGTVFIRALVNKNGDIETAEVLKGPDLLHEAAIKAALATKFTPAKQNDVPVKCWVQMRFTFELER